MNRTKKNLVLMIIIVLIPLFSLGCRQNNAQADKNNQNGQGEQIKELTVEDLFPLTVGDYWKYQGTGIEFAPFEQTVLFREDNRVQMQLANPGATLGMIYEFQEGRLAVVYSDEEMYEEENILNRENTMESIILQEPIEIGGAWETADDRDFVITNLSAVVETPAGTFTDCVEIKSSFTGQDGINIMYYKPFLGLVKQIYEEDDFMIIQELEEFKVATYDIE